MNIRKSMEMQRKYIDGTEEIHYEYIRNTMKNCKKYIEHVRREDIHSI